MSTDSLSFSLLTILMATFWQVTQWTPSFTRPETQVGRSHMIWHFLIGPVTGLETFLKSVTFPFLECSISRTLRWFSDRSWVGGSKQLFSCCSLRLNNLASNVSGWCCSTTDEKANGRQMRYTSMGKATMDQSHSQNGEYKWLHLCWGILQTRIYFRCISTHEHTCEDFCIFILINEVKFNSVEIHNILIKSHTLPFVSCLQQCLDVCMWSKLLGWWMCQNKPLLLFTKTIHQ